MRHKLLLKAIKEMEIGSFFDMGNSPGEKIKVDIENNKNSRRIKQFKTRS